MWGVDATYDVRMTDTPDPAPPAEHDSAAYALSFAIVVLTVIVFDQLGRFWWCVGGYTFAADVAIGPTEFSGLTLRSGHRSLARGE